MKKIAFLITFFSLTITMCHAQSSDEEKYEQASSYFEAKEYEKAIPILKELADKNHAKALNLLGVFYNYGYIVPKNMQKAVELYQKSAELGWRGAQRNLGICYEMGEGVSQNKEKAYIWYDKALRQYKELAEKGDADAQLEMGAIYYHGRIRSGKDYSKALPWLEKSADQGNDKAFNLLGLMYQFSYGVEKDVNKAYNYYLKGAEKENCYAQRNLAWLFQDEQFRELHSSGEGETYHEDFDFDRQTEKWLRMAAKQNADYMYELACFYNDMQVLDEWQHTNPDMWLKKAADGGCAKAQASVGSGYIYERKYSEALQMLQLAINNGVTTLSQHDENDEELRLDALMMICHYLEQHKEYKLKYAYYQDGDNIIIAVEKEEEKEGFLKLSKNGKIMDSTAFVYTNLSYHSGDKPEISYFDNDKYIEILLTKEGVDIEMLNCINHYFKQHKDLKFERAIYQGGDIVYFIISNENEKYSFIKFSKTRGEIINNTSFDYSTLYYSPSEFNFTDNQVISGHLYYIGNTINLDAFFVMSYFFKNNTKYRFQSDALYIDRESFLVSVENEEGKYGWIKLSTSGRILASTPFTTSNYWYNSNDQLFYYYEGVTPKNIDLHNMMSRFK